MQKVSAHRMHRVLRISTDNAFCLHSKERVPYHIIIEVAYDPLPELPSSEEEKHQDSNNDYVGDNPFLQGARSPRSKIQKHVDKLKKFVV